MKRLGTYLFTAFLLLQTMIADAQQTIQFTQYVFNGLAVNPGYAGYKEEWNLGMSYRMQWTGFDGSPRTGTFSADGVLSEESRNVGMGFILTSDRLGPQKTSSAFLNYSYRLRLDDEDSKRLCFGIGLGAFQYSLDPTLFKANDITDNSIPLTNESKMAPDIRLGVYFYSDKIYAGFSAMNLLSSSLKSSFSNFALQTRHYYLTAGMLLPLNNNIDLKPSLMLKEDFNGPTNLDICNYVAFNRKVWLGASWRTGIALWNKPDLQNGLSKSDAFAGILQVFFNERYRFGYSYDVTTSKLSNYQNGSHEISFGLVLNRKKDRILSPRFF